jgi:NADH-quinone oxidoreductase subunit H
MSFLIVILFLGGWLPLYNGLVLTIIAKEIWLIIKVSLILYIFVLVRGSLPRYRYDQLMSIGWKIFLPLSLGYLILYIILFYIIEKLI